MLETMSKQKQKSYPKPAGTKDVFARLESEWVDKLDTLVAEIDPATSRSAVIASIIKQYVNERWSKRK